MNLSETGLQGPPAVREQLPSRFGFEGFRVDVELRRVCNADGRPLPLTRRAFDTLCCLAARRDRVVSKDELLARVWRGRIVEENNLAQAVSMLRRQLRDVRGDRRLILTVPGHGYRFVAELVPLDPRPRATTVAVLPLRVLARGAGDALLALGMADSLVTALVHATGLHVDAPALTGTTGRRREPLEVARSLRADYVIDGSIQYLGMCIRLNARLLSVADGATVWAETFDATVDDFFAVQDRVSAVLVSVLSGAGRPRAH